MAAHVAQAIGRKNLQSRPDPRAAASQPSGVLQRSKKHGSSGMGGSMIYRSWRGEVVVLHDDGKYLRAYINGREAGYLQYSIDTEYGVTRYSFGYILVQPAHQSKKLSSLLLYVFARKALNAGAPLIQVVKPDPNLAGYWEHVGFNYREAQRLERKRLAKQYNRREDELGNVVIVQADGPAGRVLRLNQMIAAGYWDLAGEDPGTSTSSWYQWQKRQLIGYNMYEGRVTPLRDYSSSYIS